MIKTKIDDIEFKLREYQDFSWLNNYGKVFYVIDETGSGCISFGIEKDNKDLLIGTGYNTWGMTNGTLAGKILSDLILEKENKYTNYLLHSFTKILRCSNVK